MKNYYKNKKERIKEYKKKYYNENKEKLNEQKKKNYQKNKDIIREKQKEYRNENKEKINEYQKKYRRENKDKINEYFNNYIEKNKETLKEWSKNYYKENKEKIRIYQQKNKEKINSRDLEYRKNRRESDEGYRILSNLRTRLNHALKGNVKSQKTMELLGCSIEFLIDYLEKTKVDGKDYSDAHIDHIRPCASFDMTDPEQQRECFHYTNLQYLPAKENMSKGAKFNTN